MSPVCTKADGEWQMLYASFTFYFWIKPHSLFFRAPNNAAPRSNWEISSHFGIVQKIGNKQFGHGHLVALRSIQFMFLHRIGRLKRRSPIEIALPYATEWSTTGTCKWDQKTRKWKSSLLERINWAREKSDENSSNKIPRGSGREKTGDREQNPNREQWRM